MGVKSLWDVLESCKKTLPLHHLQNKRICVDLSCWIVQLQTASKSQPFSREKVYLRGIFHRLRALIALNCTVILVADGAIPAIKLATYRRRLSLMTGVNHPDEVNAEKVSLQRHKGSEFSCMVKEAKLLGMALGIPCLDGIEEAEAQCALLNSESLCDGCFSLDSDIFLFGARTVYKDICLDAGHVVCYEMSDIERQTGFGRNSLITLGLLLGSDYSNGVRGLRRESACQIVKAIGDDFVLQKIASEGLSFATKKKKVSKKPVQALTDNKENSFSLVKDTNGSKTCSANTFSYQEVVDAFLKPKCHLADSDAVYSVLVQRPYNHVKVQQACGRFFEWPTEKTDEYMLPKIAERELRRFANLRLTSSEFGVNLPLEKIPTKCPVSGIVKPRKVHGKECYEVLWENMYGLKSSIVPADLIQSACPEKIAEFEEQKAQKKQQMHPKARSKKPVDESYMSDIDRRLKNLLLEIESGSNSSASPSLSTSTTEKRETATEDSNSEMTSVDKGWESCYGRESEIIDLLSPSPPRLQSRLAAKQRGSISDRTVIHVLSDSETEVSPDHARKARELRMFIAGIKD